MSEQVKDEAMELKQLRHENQVLRESLRAISQERGDAIVRVEIVSSKNEDGSMSQVMIVSYPVLDASKEEELCKRFVRTFHALLGLEPVGPMNFVGHNAEADRG